MQTFKGGRGEGVVCGCVCDGK